MVRRIRRDDIRLSMDKRFKETSTKIAETNKHGQPIDHLCLHLFNGERPADIPPDVIQIVSAPGEPREVREVIRQILRASQEKEIAFHEIGILLRDPGASSGLFRETFDGLGIDSVL